MGFCLPFLCSGLLKQDRQASECKSVIYSMNEFHCQSMIVTSNLPCNCKAYPLDQTIPKCKQIEYRLNPIYRNENVIWKNIKFFVNCCRMRYDNAESKKC